MGNGEGGDESTGAMRAPAATPDNACRSHSRRYWRGHIVRGAAGNRSHQPVPLRTLHMSSPAARARSPAPACSRGSGLAHRHAPPPSSPEAARTARHASQYLLPCTRTPARAPPWARLPARGQPRAGGTGSIRARETWRSRDRTSDRGSARSVAGTRPLRWGRCPAPGAWPQGTSPATWSASGLYSTNRVITNHSSVSLG